VNPRYYGMPLMTTVGGQQHPDLLVMGRVPSTTTSATVLDAQQREYPC
jgi:hypothetical protein